MTRYQVGGVLTGPDALYVERAADVALKDALQSGELSHVLAPRQIGKSSLRVRAAKWLESQGIRCVQIDLTSLGSQGTTEQWYFGLIDEIGQSLGLDDVDPFWSSHPRLAPVARWTAWVERALVPALNGGRVVIFLDEIDFVRALERDGDDFLASVRSLAESPVVRAHVTFCLIGVASPSALIRDPDRTPFNVGRPIILEDFTRAEMEALAPGLASAGLDAATHLDAVHGWTGGHPYMTAKVLDALVRAGGGDVDALVRSLFLERPFEDFNLKYAEDRFVLDLPEAPALKKLSLYRRAFFEGRAPAASADPVETELLLAGMVRRVRDGDGTWLAVRNRIFASVFGEAWIRARSTRRDFDDALTRWLAGTPEEKPALLLRGKALEAAAAWAAGRRDLTPDEEEFLRESAHFQEREASERAALRAKAFWWSLAALGLAVGMAVSSFVAWRFAKRGERAAEEALADRLDYEQRFVALEERRLKLEAQLERVQSSAEGAAGEVLSLRTELSKLDAESKRMAGEYQGTSAAALVAQKAAENLRDAPEAGAASSRGTDELARLRTENDRLHRKIGQLEGDVRKLEANLGETETRASKLEEVVEENAKAYPGEQRPWVLPLPGDAPSLEKHLQDLGRQLVVREKRDGVACKSIVDEGTLTLKCSGGRVSP